MTRSCPECGVAGGEAHWPECSYSGGLHPSQTVAEGDCSAAVAECRRRGWAVAYVQGEGFRPCDPEDAGAYADIDRWLYWRTNGDRALVGDEPHGPGETGPFDDA